MTIKSRENLIGAWSFLIGIILAIGIGLAASFSNQIKINPMLLGILAILGMVVGYFVSEKDSKTFLMASVSIVLVSFAGIQGLMISAAIGGIEIGKVITTVLGTLLFLFVPATIMVAIKTAFSIARINPQF